MDNKTIENIARQINDSMPSGVKELAGNMEQRVKQTLQSQLSKLDLVTREELDVQQQMLLRLRERVELLEKELEATKNQNKD
ncbi:accessory factor UbiK family protein [Idiomarina loihiensis]|uniref:accessory factor UbiK family protein n=1 Tax=Idiomarina TaxID=135575 RepID=UPI00129CC5E4|nr:accessory factor UbiK family protein [Idiomarina loihiensis]MRJ44506.1 accessory factor UbiK family protein [Idiomarina loihiensis]UTW32464.1 accessory factor UbiK family protein [Idiomarina loihiensis]